MAAAGFVHGTEATQGYVFTELAGLVGPDSAALIERAVAAARIDANGGLALLLTLGALLAGFVGVLRKRSLAISMLLTLGFLLLVSLVLSAVPTHVTSRLQNWIGDVAILAEMVNFIVAYAGVCGMTTAILKWLPDLDVAWRDALTGGLVSALLFAVGKQLVSACSGRAALVTVYGAAGSLAVLALWMYYAAQAFLFGAAVAASAADGA